MLGRPGLFREPFVAELIEHGVYKFSNTRLIFIHSTVRKWYQLREDEMSRTLVFAFVALCMLAVAHDVPKGKAITITGTVVDRCV